MRAQQLTTLLATTIKARLPVMIKGAPGIGKTDIVMQAAEAAGANMVIMHPVVSDPTDFKGLPAVVDGEADFLPFGDLEELINTKTLTVAFLDDLGQAPAVVQAAAMQLILARRINGHKISKEVVFIAATNRREDRAGVTGILEPVKSRFATIVELTVNIDDWCGWAFENNVPAELIAFVRFRPTSLTEPGVVTNDIVNRPSPRTITQLGKLYTAGVTDAESLGGSAGEGFATEFIGFLRVYKDLPSIDSILTSPEKAPVPKNPAALFAISTALATRASLDSVGRIITYLCRLPDEFNVLGVRDCMRVCPKAANSPSFIKWATKYNEVLV